MLNGESAGYFFLSFLFFFWNFKIKLLALGF
jgi:hypothetical protein